MSWLRRLSVLLLLALWLPATSHCALETAGLLPAEACCTDEGDDHCGADGCAEVENDLFKRASEDACVRAPILACLWSVARVTLVAPPASHFSVGNWPPEWRPDWLPGWSFDRRAALPARAPANG